MTSAEGKKYIHSGWRASGITDAIKMGKANLTPIDPFNDLDPLLPLTEVAPEIDSVIAIIEKKNGLRSSSDHEHDISSDSDSEWEYDDERSAFHAFTLD